MIHRLRELFPTTGGDLQTSRRIEREIGDPRLALELLELVSSWGALFLAARVRYCVNERPHAMHTSASSTFR